MNAVGIIAEYNPFHNGHLYHLKKVKGMYPNDIIVLVLGGHFMQRGEASIINKWDKTRIALTYGIDIVIELPFPFATQSADFFAKGAIQILKAMNVKTFVFGSEVNNIDKLKTVADIQLNNDEYQKLVKDYLDKGNSYPSSLAKSLSSFTDIVIDTPNDILGTAYIKEIMSQQAMIKPVSIKRINDYHSTEMNNHITSATSIRNALKSKKEVIKLVPPKTYEYLNQNLFYIEDYFPYLKYQILINIDRLNEFQTVDEGIENRIRKHILNANSFDELISNVKTKRYTHNKLRRMFTHIMCNFTKQEAISYSDINYLRILGFNDKGQAYLNYIKKDVSLPIITKFNQNNDPMVDLEFRTTCVYASILPEQEKKELIEREYKNTPIIYNKTV